MAKEFTHSFVVAVAFYAAGSKAMPQTMEINIWNVQLLKEPLIIFAVNGRLGGPMAPRQEVMAAIGPSLQGSQETQELAGQRNVTERVGRFWGSDVYKRQAGRFVNALKSFVYVYHLCPQVNVFPAQGADFADAHAGAQA